MSNAYKMAFDGYH